MSSEFKCQACGATFSTQHDLEEHGKMHMSSPQEFKCEACGMSFPSKEALMEHAGKAHAK